MVDVTNEPVKQEEFDLDSNPFGIPAAVFVQNDNENRVPAFDITMNYNQSKGVKREKVKWQILPVAVYLKNPMNKPIIPTANLTANIRKGIDQKSVTMSTAKADIETALLKASLSLGVTIGKTTDTENYGFESESKVNVTLDKELNYYFFQTSVLFCFRCPSGAGYRKQYTHNLSELIIVDSNPGVYSVSYGLTSYDLWFFVSIDREDFLVSKKDSYYKVKTHNEMVDYFMSN
ncbi:hypothetical protein ACTFIR_007884 [Dictyostelium discoideum]